MKIAWPIHSGVGGPRVEIEVQTKGGAIKRQTKRLDKGSRLHDLSGGIEAYKDLVVTDVDANRDVIELSNGDIVTARKATRWFRIDAKGKAAHAGVEPEKGAQVDQYCGELRRAPSLSIDRLER